MPSVQTILPRQYHTLVSRAEDNSNKISGVYIAGFVVFGLLLFIAVAWLGLRYIRKRSAKKRDVKLEGAFLSVRGIVRDGPTSAAADTPSMQPQMSHGFSRNQMNPSIVMPDKALSKEEIINYHRQSGIMPKPFSFALARGGPAPLDPANDTNPPDSPNSADNRGSWIRHSFLSVGTSSNRSSAMHRFSVMSSASSYGEPTTGTVRKIRQLFDPVLPDELLLTKVGEQLVVMQSFDDGWCVVGRENASGVTFQKSLFKNAPEAENNMEVGVVPAWCFLKPVKGLRAERPVRSTSLGITVKIDAGPGFSSRDNLISWSNF